MQKIQGLGVFHNADDTSLIYSAGPASGDDLGIRYEEKFSYDFKNFFHPFVADLIKQLNQTSVAGMLDPNFLSGLDLTYAPGSYTPLDSDTVSVTLEDPRVIDVSIGGPYANYNWELLYHIPVMVAVHLSNNQRFAEAQNWFHLVFDPTSTRHQRAAAASDSGNSSYSAANPISRTSTPCSRCSAPRTRSSTRRRSRPRPPSSPATTRSSPIRSIRTPSPAPGPAPTSGTS